MIAGHALFVHLILFKTAYYTTILIDIKGQRHKVIWQSTETIRRSPTLSGITNDNYLHGKCKINVICIIVNLNHTRRHKRVAETKMNFCLISKIC